MATPRHRVAQVARYSIDTSSLIHAWHRAYPPENFLSFWSKLDDYVAKGIIVASTEVKAELKRKDDDLHGWFDTRPAGFCIDIDDAQQEHMAYIMGKHPRLVDTVKGRSGCDPFVIALARSYRTPLTVISQEGEGKANSPKIPNVCRIENMKCVDLVGFIRDEEWRL